MLRRGSLSVWVSLFLTALFLGHATMTIFIYQKQATRFADARADLLWLFSSSETLTRMSAWIYVAFTLLHCDLVITFVRHARFLANRFPFEQLHNIVGWINAVFFLQEVTQLVLKICSNSVIFKDVKCRSLVVLSCVWSDVLILWYLLVIAFSRKVCHIETYHWHFRLHILIFFLLILRTEEFSRFVLIYSGCVVTADKLYRLWNCSSHTIVAALITSEFIVLKLKRDDPVERAVPEELLIRRAPTQINNETHVHRRNSSVTDMLGTDDPELIIPSAEAASCPPRPFIDKVRKCLLGCGSLNPRKHYHESEVRISRNSPLSLTSQTLTIRNWDDHHFYIVVRVQDNSWTWDLWSMLNAVTADVQKFKVQPHDFGARSENIELSHKRSLFNAAFSEVGSALKFHIAGTRGSSICEQHSPSLSESRIMPRQTMVRAGGVDCPLRFRSERSPIATDSDKVSPARADQYSGFASYLVGQGFLSEASDSSSQYTGQRRLSSDSYAGLHGDGHDALMCNNDFFCPTLYVKYVTEQDIRQGRQALLEELSSSSTSETRRVVVPRKAVRWRFYSPWRSADDDESDEFSTTVIEKVRKWNQRIVCSCPMYTKRPAHYNGAKHRMIMCADFGVYKMLLKLEELFAYWTSDPQLRLLNETASILASSNSKFSDSSSPRHGSNEKFDTLLSTMYKYCNGMFNSMLVLSSPLTLLGTRDDFAHWVAGVTMACHVLAVIAEIGRLAEGRGSSGMSGMVGSAVDLLTIITTLLLISMNYLVRDATSESIMQVDDDELRMTRLGGLLGSFRIEYLCDVQLKCTMKWSGSKVAIIIFLGLGIMNTIRAMRNFAEAYWLRSDAITRSGVLSEFDVPATVDCVWTLTESNLDLVDHAHATLLGLLRAYSATNFSPKPAKRRTDSLPTTTGCGWFRRPKRNMPTEGHARQKDVPTMIAGYDYTFKVIIPPRLRRDVPWYQYPAFDVVTTDGHAVIKSCIQRRAPSLHRSANIRLELGEDHRTCREVACCYQDLREYVKSVSKNKSDLIIAPT